jgi:hypothetical protein
MTPAADDQPELRLAQRLSALLVAYKLAYLLQDPQPLFGLHVSGLLLAAGALAWPAVLERSATWLGLFASYALIVVNGFTHLDNHYFLIAYWLLAVVVVHALPDRQRMPSLRLQARVLVGLCMAWAVVHKLRSPAYLDGSFINYYLLFQAKFHFIARLAGDIDEASLRASYTAVETALHDPLWRDRPLPIPISNTPRMASLALFIAWSGLALETITAALFLLPERLRLSPLRDFALMAFALSLYSLVSVPGFAFALLLMGHTQAGSKLARRGYVATAALTLLLTFARANLYVSR